MGIIELNAIFVISLFDCLFNLVKVPVSVGNGLKKGRAVMIMCNLLYLFVYIVGDIIIMYAQLPESCYN